MIWCEDHGDLAYFSAADGELCDGIGLDAGDLVQFDLTEDRVMRRARNPRIVAEEQYPTLATRLQEANHMASEKVNIPPVSRPEGEEGSAIVLPFAPRRKTAKTRPCEIAGTTS
ncbi:hypothetical protein [Pseudooceanicola nanhaiensis]|uniref:hypothetical protein n=1 Tax=Pseudooceanicola nanhaiensis TaxID=375761 RepID=UPI001CD6BA12|nr:hypothetical protein [Pseudooceanicola nanhaiensis]MCA0920965.1 hypothetical protein [Pseudooceanicola nanhaiensis]